MACGERGSVYSEGRSLAVGEPVRVFYHAETHPGGFRYVRLADPELAQCSRAVIGLSTGWVPATVAEAWSPDVLRAEGSEQRVLVQMHGTFDDAYHVEKQPPRDMYWRVERKHVRRIDERQELPEVSLLVVRWWDYWNRRNQRSRCHNVANEEMLLDVLQGPGSPKEAFFERGSYEVHSAFIRESSDLQLVGEAVARSMRGRHRAALYFLWPSQRPSRRPPGAVGEPELFELMTRMEGLGVQTCWPHPAPLYRQLAGKLWLTRVSTGRPDLRVPLTVQVDVGAWRRAPGRLAEETIWELEVLQAARGRSHPGEEFRGVVKLGFSWMGEDVRPFSGQAQLETVLGQLLDGCSEDTVCFVQERVEGVAYECRLVCCRDLARGDAAVSWELARMRQKSGRQHFLDSSFTLASHENMSAEETAAMLFGGDRSVVLAAEAEAQRIGGLWLEWFQAEGYGTPGPAFRLDFLVARPREAGSAPEVWTVEVCECGGSLCGFGPETRAAACLNECLHARTNGFVQGEGPPPQRLPPFAPMAERREREQHHHDGGSGGRGAAAPPRQQQQQARRGDAAGAALAPRRPKAGEGGPSLVLIASLLFVLAAVVSRLRARPPRFLLALVASVTRR